MSNKTIFVVSPGRTGTAWLAELFRRNVRDCAAFHEHLNPEAWGKMTPDISVMAGYNTFGKGDPAVAHFWLSKAAIIRDLFREDLYVETSHVQCKAGLLEYIEFFPEPFVIFIDRYAPDVAASMKRRHDYMCFGNTYLFHLWPTYRLNRVNAAEYAEHHEDNTIAWYLVEMAARSHECMDLCMEKGIDHMTIDFADMITYAGAKRVLSWLPEAMLEDEIILPEKMNG